MTYTKTDYEILHLGGKWVVYLAHSARFLGEFDTKQEAENFTESGISWVISHPGLTVGLGADYNLVSVCSDIPGVFVWAIATSGGWLDEEFDTYQEAEDFAEAWLVESGH